MKEKFLELLRSENAIAHRNYHATKSMAEGKSHAVNYWYTRNVFSKKLIELINSYLPDEAINDLFAELVFNLIKKESYSIKGNSTEQQSNSIYSCIKDEDYEEFYPEIYQGVAVRHICTTEDLFNAMEGNLTLSAKELNYYAQFFDRGYQWWQIKRLLH
jgi:hypothetical protein